MGKQITPSEASALCDNFDEKYTKLSDLIGKKDSRSAGFSIQEIKDYLAYLETNNKNVDGIRIFLGSNKDTNYTTVFFAPTENGSVEKNLNCFNFGTKDNPPGKKY